MRLRLAYRSLLSLGIVVASFPRVKKRFAWNKKDYRLIFLSDVNSLKVLHPRMIVKKDISHGLKLFFDDDFNIVSLDDVRGRHIHALTITTEYTVGRISKRGYRHLKGIYYINVIGTKK